MRVCSLFFFILITHPQSPMNVYYYYYYYYYDCPRTLPVVSKVVALITEQHLWCSCCTAFLASVACACTTRVDPRSPSWNTRMCVVLHKSWLHYKAPFYYHLIAARYVSSTPKAKWLQRSVLFAFAQFMTGVD